VKCCYTRQLREVAIDCYEEPWKPEGLDQVDTEEHSLFSLFSHGRLGGLICPAMKKSPVKRQHSWEATAVGMFVPLVRARMKELKVGLVGWGITLRTI
jgi:hypothetical protein